MKNTEPMDLTVGAAARSLGVSVRTLHHWDEIRLLRASGRSTGGYRLYSAVDLARAQRILVYRELDFPLAEIALLLDDPQTDTDAHLERQRRLLSDRIGELSSVAEAVERVIAARQSGIALTAAEQVEIFGQDWKPEWQQEARERWGESEAWQQSVQRRAQLGPEDWRAISAEAEVLLRDLGAAARDGVPAGSDRARDLVERHRGQISRYFDCPRARQVVLTHLYVDDERFRAYYDKSAPGTAEWLRGAVASAARAEGIDPDSAEWG